LIWKFKKVFMRPWHMLKWSHLVQPRSAARNSRIHEDRERECKLPIIRN
jgi:hypothetical protein